MKLFQKFDLVGFISNIMAVILGIIITFSIQEVINDKDEEDNVKAALELVRDELTSCLNDLETYAETLNYRSAGARYVLTHKDTLTKCPPDSIQTYGMMILYGEMILTLPDDAMELLKTSSLFQSINDNELAMKIIGAYDRCHIMVQLFNSNEAKFQKLNEEYINSNKKEFFDNEGTIFLSHMAADPEGYYFLMKLSGYSLNHFLPYFEDIRSVIADINAYLAK